MGVCSKVCAHLYMCVLNLIANNRLPSNKICYNHRILLSSGPTAGPANVTVVSVTATTVHLTWDHPPEETHQGVIRGYTLNVTELETGRTLRETTPETEIVIDSLHPFYTYKITIIAFTIEEGSNHTTIYVETDEAGKLEYGQFVAFIESVYMLCVHVGIYLISSCRVNCTALHHHSTQLSTT